MPTDMETICGGAVEEWTTEAGMKLGVEYPNATESPGWNVGGAWLCDGGTALDLTPAPTNGKALSHIRSRKWWRSVDIRSTITATHR